MERPMYFEEKPSFPIKAYTGTELHCKIWDAGYEESVETAKNKKVKIPSFD